MFAGSAMAADKDLGGPVETAPKQPEKTTADRRLPTLWLIGDSTVRNGTKGQMGWGSVLSPHFDTNRITVVNRALGGRSSRTFLTEGLWQKVVDELRPGDFVLIQFGHNDGGPMDSGRARASVKGSGEDTVTITNQTSGQIEVVHTYGWYLRRYITDAKAKGATPIVLSLVPRKIWKDDKIVRAADSYMLWASEAANAEGVGFIDLNERVAAKYDQLSRDEVTALFADDHTHTNTEGAALSATTVAEGIRALPECPLAAYLRPDTEATPPR